MESLYRKYRPQTFSDVVGQQHVVGTLERAVMEGRVSHAYLFCGPRGTGKTTMARLLAKALMCEHGPGQLPDGTCRQCQLIAAGEHPDVYELDAASRTGVDNVREEIINRVSYAPVQGRYKVYVIDEVHMLTTQAFNALLKTLEEPPEHVVFVLCTTDPQKIPATILSRVQRFDFRPIGSDDIHARLAYVCEQEGFTYEDAALELVVRQARGGMRDALSALEKLSVFGSGVITLEATQDLLGAVPGAALNDVMAAMAARDVAALFSQVGTLVDSGRDLLQFTRELAARVRDAYVVAVVGANPSVLPAGSDAQLLQAEASAFGTPDRLSRILTLLGDVSREMGSSPNQRLVLEIAFTRIARPATDLTLESLSERLAELEARMGQASLSMSPMPEASQTNPLPEAAAAQTPLPESAQAPRSYQPPVAPQSRQVPQLASWPVPEPPAQQQPAVQPKPQAQSVQPSRQAGQSAGFAKGELQRRWKQVVQDIVARNPARGSLLSSAMASSDDGTKLVVGLPQGSTFALKMLERSDVRQAVETTVNEVFGPRTVVYKEGIGQDLRMPATQPAPAPVSQSPAYVPATPYETQSAAPMPQPAPPMPQPAPPAPQSTAPAYPMPWEDPRAQQYGAAPVAAPDNATAQAVPPYVEATYAPSPREEGYFAPAPSPGQPASAQSAPSQATYSQDDYVYESVPYDDVMAGPYMAEESDNTAPQGQPDSGQWTEQETSPAPDAQPTSQPAAESVATSASPAPAPAPAPAAPSRPDSEPTSPALSKDTGSSRAPKADDAPEFVDVDDLPDDLRAVLSNVFEVFGEGVKISKEK